MKLLDNKLFLEIADLVESGVSEKYLWKAKSTGVKSFTFCQDPSDGRKVLVEWETLKANYKEMVQRRFGNPYDYLVKEPIRKMVVKDLQAESYFLQYRYEGNRSLPIETVQRYTAAASWLNMLIKAEADKKEIKRLLNLSLMDFWLKVCEVLQADRIDLPYSYKRLREKIKEYQVQSYSCLIHKTYGKANALKVKSEVSQALLLELIAQPYHDDVVICRQYNAWAEKNGHKTITPDTVGNWRRNNEVLILAQKKGVAAFYNAAGKVIGRERPSAPMLLWNSDDNNFDLYFRGEQANKKGHTIINYFNRFMLVVVMDAYNDYILGWAMAPTVTADLVRDAYLNAMHHIHDLTGGWYLPYQLQTDRWGLSNLEGFYKSICRAYTPATAKVARAKHIEQAFGIRWHQELKGYKGYSSHNVTAKAKLNSDHLELTKRDFYTVEEAPQVIGHFIDRMRRISKTEGGPTRQQEWLDAFWASEKSRQSQIDRLQMLALFGRRHQHTNQITNWGLRPAINCVERTYEVPNDLYLDTIGKEAQVIYDPLDYSNILVEAGNMRFLAHTKELMKSAIADQSEGDRARLNALLAEKKEHVQKIGEAKERRQQLLQQHMLDAEGLLQVGPILPKELHQQAELAYRQHSLGAPAPSIEYDPLDDM